jgi:TPR repeat protein
MNLQTKLSVLLIFVSSFLVLTGCGHSPKAEDVTKMNDIQLEDSAMSGHAEAQNRYGDKASEEIFAKGQEQLPEIEEQKNDFTNISTDFREYRNAMKSAGGSRSYFEKNYREKISTWKESAEQGNAEAQMLMSACYLLGIGVPKNPEKAMEWLRKSAAQGFSAAQYDLADDYFYGLAGIDKDEHMATLLFRRSAEQGYAPAQLRLGLGYAYGRGVPQDYEKAAYWYARAAENGEREAAVEYLKELQQMIRKHRELLK